MISVFGSFVDDKEIELVANCMKSQWLGFGKTVSEFERAFADKYDLPDLVMVDSGSNALYMAVHLLNLPAQSEVIVPSFTWVSCAQAVILAGHIPVFCDVDLVTMNVTAETIKKKITSRTAAVMVVHYAGLSVDMNPIVALGLPIIEDVAHALASTYKGQPCGTFGDVAIYSFDAVKNLTVGEGGGVTSIHPEHLKRARNLRYCGIGKSGFESVAVGGDADKWWEYNITEPFIKMLPTNLNASIGMGQLEKIDALQLRRKVIWERYKKEFSCIDEVICPVDAPIGDKHSYFTFSIRAKNRDPLANYLLERGIYTTLRYHPLHMNPLYGSVDQDLPNSCILNSEALSIPLHPRLSDNEVSFVINEIKNFYSN